MNNLDSTAPLQAASLTAKTLKRAAGMIVASLLTLPVAGCLPIDGVRSSNTTESTSTAFRDLKQHTFAEGKYSRAYAPTLTPDATRLAYVSHPRGQRTQTQNSDIFLKGVYSKAKTQKTTHGSLDAYPRISPDGSKLAFASARNGSWDIFITNLGSGRAKRQITATAEHEIAPSWSPDGQRITYSRLSRSTGEWEIWIYDLQSSAVTNLVPGLNPSYSPTENVIAFQRVDSETGHSSIWTIDELGTVETQIVSSSDESFITPSWSPDGTSLVFASGAKAKRSNLSLNSNSYTRARSIVERTGFDIWTVRADGTNLNQLTTHKAKDWSPAWASDGRIYFSSERGDAPNIWSVVPEFVETDTPDSQPAPPKTEPKKGK